MKAVLSWMWHKHVIRKGVMFVWEGQECMGSKYFNSSVFLHSDVSIQNFEEEI
jgi:hypothetical protein